jgi:hypothetical protein
MPDRLSTSTFLPLVQFEIAAHRSGIGLLRLDYLPAVPGPALTEEEASRAIISVRVALTERTCNELGEGLLELGRQLAKAKGAHN